MMHPDQIPDVADNELLARFIVNSNEKRPDGKVSHKLFMPYKWVELSVNRHREATLEEIWQVGSEVAVSRNKSLYGLANIRASQCRIQSLHVVPAPILPGNPNHANITGYPAAKEDQMAIANELAASIEGKWIPPPA
ncbi:MAG: hypothetical protein ACKO3T_21365 [Planctomycetaceae bacterium]|jgi:hypothetical protein